MSILNGHMVLCHFRSESALIVIKLFPFSPSNVSSLFSLFQCTDPKFCVFSLSLGEFALFTKNREQAAVYERENIKGVWKKCGGGKWWMDVRMYGDH